MFRRYTTSEADNLFQGLKKALLNRRLVIAVCVLILLGPAWVSEYFNTISDGSVVVNVVFLLLPGVLRVLCHRSSFDLDLVQYG